MKIQDLPDFAKPYKTKGYDVMLSKNSYQLFRITSVRIEGKKFPQPQATYIGTIDPIKGLIPKKIETKQQYPIDTVEFGLSDFVIRHFKRQVSRSIYNCSRKLFYMGVIYFLYGHIEERFVRLSYVQRYLEDMPPLSGANALKRVSSVADKIAFCLSAVFTDSSDLAYVTARLRAITVNPAASRPEITYPDELIEIFHKYGVKE